jgi:short chain dehydrogenase
MNLDFTGKAIVTGGAMGIGEATTRKLAGLEASVAILDVDGDAGPGSAAAITKNGDICEFFRCNISVGKEVSQAVDAVVNKYRAIDILVSNAGIQLYGDAVTTVADDDSATLVMEVTLSAYHLHFRREISLPGEAFTACITETVTNISSDAVEFQWVQHAAFGEPFFANGEATLFVSGKRGVIWPAGYEGRELLARDVELQWPYAQSIDGEPINLSQPFVRDGTGFVAGVLADSDRENAFAAVHDRRHQLVAGYCFNPMLFPWIVLWEENRAREYAPWNKRTRARGVEFGTSPMPLGLAHAREMRRLFDTPVLSSIPAGSCLEAQYDLFLHPVPAQWTQIKDVRQTEHTLLLRGDNDQGDGDEEITLQRGRRRR